MFVNPGSPTRMRTDEINRKPKVMLVNISKDKGIEIEYIYLKSAPPGEDVLDTSIKENKIRKSNTLKDVKERVKESSKLGASIDEIIKVIAKESDLPENITDRAISRVEEKMNSQNDSGDKSSKTSEKYYIKTLQLTNFGSHESTTFEFKEGLNIFVGQTASGKTTCFRAFKWIYDDYGTSKRLIKRGKKSCEATITTSHGYVISRFITTKARKSNDGKSIKNGYEIIHPNGDIEVLNTKGVERVKEILSYKKLDLETKSVDLNFLDQGDSWFFIGSKYTSTDRAKMIGAIHKTHYVDLVIKDLEAENKRLNQRRNDKVIDSEKLQSEIESYGYLEDMKSNLEDINKRKENLLKLVSLNNKLNELIERQDDLDKKISDCNIVINSIGVDKLEQAKNKIKSLRVTIDNLNRTNSMISKYIELEESIKIEDDIIQSIDIVKIKKSKEILHQTKDNLLLYTRLDNLTKRYDSIEFNIKKCDEITSSISSEKIESLRNILSSVNKNLDTYKNLTTLMNKRFDILSKVNEMDSEVNKIDLEKLTKSLESIKNIRENISKLDSLKRILQKRTAIEGEVLKLNKIIDDSEKFIDDEIEKYKELLVMNGKCPICDSNIDKITAQQIANNKKENLKLKKIKRRD